MASCKLLTIALFTLLVTACASPAPIVVGCPAIHEWNATEQLKMWNELETLPEPSIVRDAFMDYAKIRQEAKACRGK